MSDIKLQEPDVSSSQNKKIFINRAELKSQGVWLSNTQLLRLEAGKRFPRRVRISAASVCWPFDEILEWIKKKKEERDKYIYADMQ